MSPTRIASLLALLAAAAAGDPAAAQDRPHVDDRPWEGALPHPRQDHSKWTEKDRPEWFAVLVRDAETGAPIRSEMKHKTHLLFRWAADLARNSRVLDAVEDLIGPDILCWSTTFFIKEAHSPSFISYHQDLTYWGLDPADVVTAWVALAPATIESGAMRFLPGSHTTEVLPHKDTFNKDNLLTRGQEVAVEVDESKLVDIVHGERIDFQAERS